MWGEVLFKWTVNVFFLAHVIVSDIAYLCQFLSLTVHGLFLRKQISASVKICLCFLDVLFSLNWYADRLWTTWYPFFSPVEVFFRSVLLLVDQLLMGDGKTHLFSLILPKRMKTTHTISVPLIRDHILVLKGFFYHKPNNSKLFQTSELQNRTHVSKLDIVISKRHHIHTILIPLVLAEIITKVLGFYCKMLRLSIYQSINN